MAVAYETSLTPTAVTFDAAGEAETVAFDAGSGANRVLLVLVFWRDQANDISGVTYNGVAMTELGAKVAEEQAAIHGFRLANPASGSHDIVVTMGAGGGNSLALIGAVVVNGADIAGTPVDGFQSGDGQASTANVISTLSSPVSSAAGDRVVFFAGSYNETATLTAEAENYTERQDANNASGMSLTYGDADGAATVEPRATWSNGAFLVKWTAIGINVNASGASEDITLDKWLGRYELKRRQRVHMVASGMTPPDRND
jgi:hypothetical protein